MAMLGVTVVSAKRFVSGMGQVNESRDAVNTRKVTLTGKIVLALGAVIFLCFIGIVILMGFSSLAIIMLCLFSVALSVFSVKADKCGGSRK